MVVVPAWRPGWINRLLGVLAHTQREAVRGLSEGRESEKALLRVRNLNTLADGAPMPNKKSSFSRALDWVLGTSSLWAEVQEATANRRVHKLAGMFLAGDAMGLLDDASAPTVSRAGHAAVCSRAISPAILVRTEDFD